MRRILMATQFPSVCTISAKDCKESMAYQLRVKLNNHKKLNRIEMNWLTKAVNKCEHFTKSVCVGNWKFDFSDVLQTYKVRTKDVWKYYYATDLPALLKFMGSKAELVIVEN